MTNHPLHTIRDKLIKATIWKNQTADNKIFYSVDISRSYEKDGNWAETNSFSGAELLRVSNLSREAYNFILTQEAADKAAQKRAGNPAPEYPEDPQGGSAEYPN